MILFCSRIQNYPSTHSVIKSIKFTRRHPNLLPRPSFTSQKYNWKLSMRVGWNNTGLVYNKPSSTPFLHPLRAGVCTEMFNMLLEVSGCLLIRQQHYHPSSLWYDWLRMCRQVDGADPQSNRRGGRRIGGWLWPSTLWERRRPTQGVAAWSCVCVCVFVGSST